jgi:protein disulfide isomerase family A protein 3
MSRLLRSLLLLNVLALHFAHVIASEDEGGMPYGDDDYPEDGGYGGGDDYPPTPPSPPSEELDSVDAFDAFIDNEDASVIGAFSSEDDAAFSAFQEATQAMQYDWRFAHTTNKEVLEKLKVKKEAVLLYRSPRYLSEKYGDRKRERFPSTKLAEASLKNWLLSNAQPLVGQYTHTSKGRYLAKKLPVVIIFFNLNWAGDAKGAGYVLNRARKVATAFAGKLSFAVAALSDYEYQLADFGLKSEDSKHDVRIGLLHKVGSDELYYGCEETKFSADVLSAFATAYVAGELEPSKKVDTSAPPPPMDDDGGDVDESAVVTLTSDNFDEVVHDESKDVLVEFYAPWCGHCKALKPEYAKAAKALAGTDSIVMAKLDATAHDVPKGFDVQGYPTILFVPAKAGAVPEPYEGEREADAMVEWLKSNALSLK